MLSFYIEAGDLNLGPDDCLASIYLLISTSLKIVSFILGCGGGLL